MVKFKLEKLHTHCGKQYNAGDTIEVDEATAKWMIEQGVGVVVSKEAPVVTPESIEPESESEGSKPKAPRVWKSKGD